MNSSLEKTEQRGCSVVVKKNRIATEDVEKWSKRNRAVANINYQMEQRSGGEQEPYKGTENRG